MEDDPILGYALKEYLELMQFRVVWESDGVGGVKKFQSESFNLCIIDIMMPQKDGFTVAKEIKSYDEKVPFLFLTARYQKVDKLKAFKLGADDFIVKPVDEEELIARIKAILRRREPVPASRENYFSLGAFKFFPHNQRLMNGGHTIDLTGKETQLLNMLCERKGQLLTRDSALNEIWGENDYFTRRTMDVHIARIRSYLKKDPQVSIKNVHGKGFRLEIQEAEK